jgi:DNA-binding transcriptional regulator/RsmH inhibitor MraZ
MPRIAKPKTARRKGAPPVLTGTYYYTVDAKGRVVVPATFHAALGGRLLLTVGAPGTLVLFNSADVALRCAWLLGTKERARALLAQALPVERDKNTGRITIPHHLRAHAGIVTGVYQEVAVIGFGEVAVIMPGEHWQEQTRQALRRILGMDGVAV